MTMDAGAQAQGPSPERDTQGEGCRQRLCFGRTLPELPQRSRGRGLAGVPAGRVCCRDRKAVPGLVSTFASTRSLAR